MRALATLAVLLAAASGCRDFQLQPERKKDLAERCTAAADCQSGVCLPEGDGVAFCCDRACEPWESCRAKGHEGTCTPNAPGTPCAADGQCAAPGGGGTAGFCEEGVCCNKRCESWQTCVKGGFVGSCTAALSMGALCTSDAQCPPAAGQTAGHCVKNTCCSQACQSWERCAKDGTRCEVELAVGAPCAASAQCPPPPGAPGGTAGSCVDGVCCDGECGGLCQFCARPGLEGRCLPQLNNEDLRSECGGCGACFDGVCAPAVPGTDPNGACGEGRVCGLDRSCGLPGGAACADDRECGVGACIGGRCLAFDSEPVFASPMDPGALQRDVLAVAANAFGDTSVVLDERASTAGSTSATVHTLFVAHRTPAGWRAVPAARCEMFSSGSGSGYSYPRILAGLAYQGRTGFLAASRDPVGDCEWTAPDAPPEGIWGRFLVPTGELGAPEPVDPDARDVGWVSVQADAAGLFVAYSTECATGRCVVVRQRGAGAPDARVPAWTEAMRVPFTSPLWEMRMVAGRPVVAFVDEAGVAAYRLGDPPVTDPTPRDLSCDGITLYAAERTQGAEAGLLLAVTECAGSFSRRVRAVTFWPDRPAEGQWSYEPQRGYGDILGVAAGGPTGALAVVRLTGPSNTLSELVHTALGAAGREEELALAPPGVQDLSTYTAAGITGADGLAQYVVALGQQAVDPVPRDLVLVRLRP